MCHHTCQDQRRARLAHQTSTPPDTGHHRVSDEDREQTAGMLRDAAGAGRLDTTELGDRLIATWSAHTRDELAAITADLPTDQHARGTRPTSTRRLSRTAMPFVALTVAVLIMLTIWLATGTGYFWPIWPALGWLPWILIWSRSGYIYRARPTTTACL